MTGTGALAQELNRYRDLLEPLSQLATDGPHQLPAEERPAWDAAIETLYGYHGNALDLEEAVASFARALWTAPAWAEPPARIAEALLVRSRRWPERARDEALALARGFAERGFKLGPSDPAPVIALSRMRLATGQLEEARSLLSRIPADEPQSLAARAELAEAAGDRERAMELRQKQLEIEPRPLVQRDIRNKLGLLRQARGELDAAIACHRENLARHPDYAWGHVNLGSALESRGEWLEAYGEVETALGLGLVEARPFLDELAASLDRQALKRFRELLRTSLDHDEVDLCPVAGGAA